MAGCYSYYLATLPMTAQLAGAMGLLDSALWGLLTHHYYLLTPAVQVPTAA